MLSRGESNDLIFMALEFINPFRGTFFWCIYSKYNSNYKGFRGCWLRIWSQIFKIQNGGSNMAVKIFKKGKLMLNFGYKGFWNRWLRIWSQIFKIQMTDPIWRSKFSKIVNLMLNCGYMGFWDRWLRIWSQIFKIQNGGSNMAVKIFRKGQIDAEFWL